MIFHMAKSTIGKHNMFVVTFSEKSHTHTHTHTPLLPLSLASSVRFISFIICHINIICIFFFLLKTRKIGIYTTRKIIMPIILKCLEMSCRNETGKIHKSEDREKKKLSFAKQMILDFPTEICSPISNIFVYACVFFFFSHWVHYMYQIEKAKWSEPSSSNSRKIEVQYLLLLYNNNMV